MLEYQVTSLSYTQITSQYMIDSHHRRDHEQPIIKVASGSLRANRQGVEEDFHLIRINSELKGSIIHLSLSQGCMVFEEI